MDTPLPHHQLQNPQIKHPSPLQNPHYNRDLAPILGNLTRDISIPLPVRHAKCSRRSPPVLAFSHTPARRAMALFWFGWVRLFWN